MLVLLLGKRVISDSLKFLFFTNDQALFDASALVHRAIVRSTALRTTDSLAIGPGSRSGNILAEHE